MTVVVCDTYLFVLMIKGVYVDLDSEDTKLFR
jgi:hypothetical protein